MLGFLSKLFGSKKDKDVRELSPYIDKINAYFAQYAGLSDDELRGKTHEFKSRITAHLTDGVPAAIPG